MNRYTELADQIFDLAETGFEEYRSSELMCDFLEKEGFEVKCGIAEMPTAYVASYGSGKPVISFLAEYDALSGLSQKADEFNEIKNETNENGHGCGHHLLGTGAIKAVVDYKNWLVENRKEGTVLLFGCPGEETGSGKAYLARAGAFKDTDIALTWHPGLYNMVVTGSSMSNVCIFFKFKGIAAHAAAAPEMGRSALDACELMNIGVNYLREHMKSTDRVHYAYVDVGGSAPNVVQSSAALKYFIRSSNNEEVKELTRRVIDCAKGAALMNGTEVEIIYDEGLSNVVTNQTLEQLCEKVFLDNYHYSLNSEDEKYAEQYRKTYDCKTNIGLIYPFVKDRKKLADNILNRPVNDYVVEVEHSEMTAPGSTDVGDVSWCVPTAQINTACYALAAEAHSWQWVAQGKSTIAHKGMELAGEILAKVAIELHEHPELIEKAKEEFKEKLNGQEYDCLIPDDIKPHISKI